MFHGPGGIADRIVQVMPPVILPHGALQSFKYCTDEEIKRDLNKDIPAKIQGKTGLTELLEADEELQKYLFYKFQKLID
jgi:hypothetical protein